MKGKRVTNKAFTSVLTSPMNRRDALKRAAAVGLTVPTVLSMPKIARAQDTIRIAYITPGLNVPFWRAWEMAIMRTSEPFQPLASSSLASTWPASYAPCSLVEMTKET